MPDHDVELAQEVIQRDPTFVRVFADSAISFFFGRELELAFLIKSQDLTVVPSEDDGESYDIKNSESEVCRVRMPPGPAITLALDILRELAPTGGLKRDPLKESLDSILNLIPSSSQQSVSDE